MIEMTKITLGGWRPNPANSDGGGTYKFQKGQSAGGTLKTIIMTDGTDTGVIDPSQVGDDSAGGGADYFAFGGTTERDVINPALRAPYNNKGKEVNVWLNAEVVKSLVVDPMFLQNQEIYVPVEGAQGFKNACSKQTTRFATATLAFTQFELVDVPDDVKSFKRDVSTQVALAKTLAYDKLEKESRAKARRRVANEIRLGIRQPLDGSVSVHNDAEKKSSNIITPEDKQEVIDEIPADEGKK